MCECVNVLPLRNTTANLLISGAICELPPAIRCQSTKIFPALGSLIAAGTPTADCLLPTAYYFLNISQHRPHYNLFHNALFGEHIGTENRIGHILRFHKAIVREISAIPAGRPDRSRQDRGNSHAIRLEFLPERFGETKQRKFCDGI